MRGMDQEQVDTPNGCRSSVELERALIEAIEMMGEVNRSLARKAAEADLGTSDVLALCKAMDTWSKLIRQARECAHVREREAVLERYEQILRDVESEPAH